MYQLWRATLALTVDVVTLVTVAMVTLLWVSKHCMYMSTSLHLTVCLLTVTMGIGHGYSR